MGKKERRGETKKERQRGEERRGGEEEKIREGNGREERKGGEVMLMMVICLELPTVEEEGRTEEAAVAGIAAAAWFRAVGPHRGPRLSGAKCCGHDGSGPRNLQNRYV